MSRLLSLPLPRPRLLLLAMLAVITGLLASAAGGPSVSAAPVHPAAAPKPTIVLVHGAWADSSSWSAVIHELEQDGYPVLAEPNPLRGLASDAAYLSAFIQ